MVLTVDIGNTNIVLGGFEGQELVFTTRIHSRKESLEDQYTVEFLSLFSLYGVSPAKFDGAILSSVVPDLTSVVQRAIRKILRGKILTVSPGMKTGLNIRIDSPADLGSDFVCAAVYALRELAPPVVIVDMGTATKISVLDRSGCFIGGSIIPGLKLSLDALTMHTAQLPQISLDIPDSPLGTNTVSCMKSGLLYGTACMIDGMVQRYCELLGEDTSVLLTGRFAEVVAPLCRHPLTVREHVILRGLKVLYDKNK